MAFQVDICMMCCSPEVKRFGHRGESAGVINKLHSFSTNSGNRVAMVCTKCALTTTLKELETALDNPVNMEDVTIKVTVYLKDREVAIG